jgi:glycosyltransferase involved in cell wall biosynthesis
MKITYIHQYFSTPQMNGGVRSFEVAKYLVSKGHEVNMITSYRGMSDLKYWYKTTEAGINVYWLPAPYSNHFSFFKRVKAFLNFAIKSSFKAASLKADVIVATSTPLTVGIPGLYASIRQNVPLVFEVRDLWPKIPISMGILKNSFLIYVLKKFESFIYSKSEIVITLSPGMKNGVIKTNYLKERITVIPNFSDLEMFSKFDKKKAIKKWNFNGPLIVYSGTFGHVNGLIYLVHLANELDKLESNVKILLVGEGKELKNITKLANYYNLLNKNFFIRKAIKKLELPNLLSIADMSSNIVINNNDVWENSANKFFDGLAAGTPMLINSGGWQADLIKKYGAGLVTHGLSFQKCAKIINACLNDEEWKKKSGRNSNNLAKKFFSKKKLVSDFEQVLILALNKQGKKAHLYGFKE